MMLEQTLSTLNHLKLFGMAKGLDDRLKIPAHADLAHDEFVGLLVQDEKADRDNRRLARLLKRAKLRYTAACLEDVDYKHTRGIQKQVFLELANPRWIPAGRNVLFTGPTGVGKSWLACALGNFAARQGFTVLYFRAPRLFEELQQSRADGSRLRLLAKLAKAQILIVDDILLTPLADQERSDLLEIIEDRYGQAATVLTSQLPTKHWHAAMGEPTLADALCDRLFHHAFKIEMKGESLRKSDDGGKKS
jgi:DNA replication protein DnaC